MPDRNSNCADKRTKTHLVFTQMVYQSQAMVGFKEILARTRAVGAHGNRNSNFRSIAHWMLETCVPRYSASQPLANAAYSASCTRHDDFPNCLGLSVPAASACNSTQDTNFTWVSDNYPARHAKPSNTDGSRRWEISHSFRLCCKIKTTF